MTQCVKMSYRLLCGFLMLCLCACSFFRTDQLNKLTEEESVKITAMSEEIIRCLTQKDKKGFQALFCEEVLQSDTFSKEVDALFAYFPCEVYITSEINGLAGGGSSVEGGKRVEWHVRAKITYIEILQRRHTNSEELDDRYYGVSYYWKIVDVNHPRLEGLHYLKMELLNSDHPIEVGVADLDEKYK